MHKKVFRRSYKPVAVAILAYALVTSCGMQGDIDAMNKSTGAIMAGLGHQMYTEEGITELMRFAAGANTGLDNVVFIARMKGLERVVSQIDESK